MSDSDTEFSAELVAEDGTRYPLSGEMRVGRSEDCEIRIDDAKVSRKHAVFRVEDQSVSVEDLGSANGTLVNGVRSEGATELKSGDTLKFERHAFTIEIQMPQSDEPDPDATIVNLPDDDATVVSGFSEAPPPEPVAEPTPTREAAPPPPPPPPPPAPSDLPGSWVDEPGTGEHTQVMDFSGAAPQAPAAVERMSDSAHLILLSESGTAAEGMELEPANSDGPDVWEIGREEDCEIALPMHDTVSARHAQLVHDGGRWSIVNLVAVNGIFVNGEKKLKAFLSDGDQIQLGDARLVFRGPAGAAGAKPSQTSGKSAPRSDSRADAGGKSNAGKLIVAVLVAAVVAVAAFLLMG